MKIYIFLFCLFLFSSLPIVDTSIVDDKMLFFEFETDEDAKIWPNHYHTASQQLELKLWIALLFLCSIFYALSKG